MRSVLYSKKRWYEHRRVAIDQQRCLRKQSFLFIAIALSMSSTVRFECDVNAYGIRRPIGFHEHIEDNKYVPDACQVCEFVFEYQ